MVQAGSLIFCQAFALLRLRDTELQGASEAMLGIANGQAAGHEDVPSSLQWMVNGLAPKVENGAAV